MQFREKIIFKKNRYHSSKHTTRRMKYLHWKLFFFEKKR